MKKNENMKDKIENRVNKNEKIINIFLVGNVLF